MEKQYISNMELYLKLWSELGNKYKIGLHNSTRFAYKFNRDFDKVYDIDGDCISEDDIILNILKKGLCVSDNIRGIKSTVTFYDKITVNSFNYSYYQYIGDKRCYVLIVAIPKYINIDKKRYFIENFIECSENVDTSLFNILLPKEFIYGYYIKNVSYTEEKNNMEEIYYKCNFDDNMEFYKNDNFYGYMDSDMQEEFWIRHFNDNEIDLKLLDNNIGLKNNVKIKIKRI